MLLWSIASFVIFFCSVISSVVCLILFFSDEANFKFEVEKTEFIFFVFILFITNSSFSAELLE